MQMEALKELDRPSGRRILVTVETGHETQRVAPLVPQTTQIRTLPTRSACMCWKVINNMHVSLIITVWFSSSSCLC